MQILTLAGTVGKDADLRQTQGGDAVLNFSLAIDNGKDSDGNKRAATWFDCSLWGKRANALQPYIHKGDKLTVTGRPTARTHNDKVYMGCNVNDLTFQGSANRDGNRDTGSQQSSGGYGGGDMDDDLPF